MTPRRKLLRRRSSAFSVTATIVAAMLIASSGRLVRGDVGFEPTWSPPASETVGQQVMAFIDQADATASEQAAARRAWSDSSAAAAGEEALLDRVIAAFAAVEPRVAELQKQWQGPFAPGDVTWISWLSDPELDPFVRDNVRLAQGRWLAQQSLYDEAIRELGELNVGDVVDPASLLFYRMAAYQQLVQPDNARAALVQLLEREQSLPRRFQELAQLVRRDLATLEDESLDHIGRRMSDIHRRLDLGHAGPRVQEVERGVLDSLDKMIDDLEKQAQSQSQCQNPGSGSNPSPSKPMQDSRLAELKAPGKVDKRDIGKTPGWGDLPPKDRERALQEIGREYPAQYREIIEQYFRELAAETPPDQP
ncbi:MAG: hypothetical protein KDA44_18595 [Planctomycetales bacterium]|nr:hypothetical protein [Planctomycetales bacterium]